MIEIEKSYRFTLINGARTFLRIVRRGGKNYELFMGSFSLFYGSLSKCKRIAGAILFLDNTNVLRWLYE